MKTRLNKKPTSSPKIALTENKKKKPNLTIQIPDKKTTLEIKVEQKKREILGFRTTNEQLYIKENKIKAYKTALLIDRDKCPADMIFNHSEQLYKIPSHRPVAKIYRKNLINSPTAIQTPRGSVLPRVARFGVMSLFSNEPNAEPIQELNPKTKLNTQSSFYSSESFKSIIQPSTTHKLFQAEITHKKLEKRRAEDLKHNFTRSISQNKIMSKRGVPERKGSATDYAYATTLFEKDVRWEWLHLVAHMIAGASSQTPDNLVAGTAFSNTEMMFAEASLNYLSRIYPNGFKLSVKAELIPTTHIATVIKYIITTPDFEIPLEFNTQTRNKPHVNYQGYFDYLVTELVQACKLHSLGKPDKSDSIITYSKSEIAKSDIPTLTKTIEPIAEAKLNTPPNRKVIIDTETTGLFIDEGHRVVEVAAVEVIDGKLTGKEFKKIINPERRIPKILHYKGIHHITDEVVKDKPTFREIADEFSQFIKNAEIIGHNLSFDITMLENEFKIAKHNNSFKERYATDTLAEAQKLLPKGKGTLLKSHKLDDLCDYYKINAHARDNGHDALIDAKLTAELYLKLKKEDNKSTKDTNRLFSQSKNESATAKLKTSDTIKRVCNKK